LIDLTKGGEEKVLTKRHVSGTLPVIDAAKFFQSEDAL
jgi:hypothetical protein